MFLCQPLLDVLICRGSEDVDAFIQPPSWNDLPDPVSIPGMTSAVDCVLAAVRGKQRVAIFGDYDCDGILGTHILRVVLASVGVQAQAYLPHQRRGIRSHFVRGSQILPERHRPADHGRQRNKRAERGSACGRTDASNDCRLP
jgi:hypothetical protein